jgi:hypothetical protein
MAPETIPQQPAAAPSEAQTPLPEPAVGPGESVGGPGASPQRGGATAPSVPVIVEFSFAADRNQLYTAWQALANLADLCGKVAVAVKGAPPQNVDQSKLENGVYEPLREANLID